MDVYSIILSAGKGSRMLSNIPKPLHLISGKSMLQWVIDANKLAGIKKSVAVVSDDFHNSDSFNHNINTVIQKKPIGTGDAVKKAIPLLNNFEGIVLVCFADTPFISSKTLKKILKAFADGTKLVITGFKKKDANEYGKIIFSNQKQPYEILEHKDVKRKKIDSDICNGGIMGIHSSALKYLSKIKKNPTSKEYYLTDIVKILNRENKKISYLEINEKEILGVNTKVINSREYSQNLFRKSYENGVKLIDPNSTFINYDTKFIKDVIIHPSVVFGNNGLLIHSWS